MSECHLIHPSSSIKELQPAFDGRCLIPKVSGRKSTVSPNNQLPSFTNVTLKYLGSYWE